MPTVVIIALCIIGPVLWALYVQRGARRRLATRELPDLPYETEGRYVVGGRYGSNPVTGAIGYDRWPFLDEGTAVYMARWLNNGDDHRSMDMVFFDWAAKVEADRLKREQERKADLVEERAKMDTLGRRRQYCEICNLPVERTYLVSDDCPSCEMAWHQRQLTATYQVPGPILGDVVRYVPGLETGYRGDSVVVCACGTYLRRGTKASKRGTCDACDYRLTFGITNIRAAATRFTASSGPR